jgi:hypothetical protein
MLAPLFSVMVATALAQAGGPKTELVVVVSAANEVREMSVASVAEVFLTRRQFWANRKPVTLVMLDDEAPLQRDFTETLLHKAPEELTRLYLQQRYRGQLTTKVFRVTTVAELVKAIADDPTAIGFVPAKAVTPELKVVLHLGEARAP